MLAEANYLPPISYMILGTKYTCWQIEQYANYQKSGCRNRCYIATSQGTLLLSIPLEKGKHQRQLMRDVRISYAYDWQKLHWQSLCTAYRSSPFFEFLEEDFYPFYHKKTTPFLLDFNLSLTRVLLDLLKIKPDISLSSQYLPPDLAHNGTENLDIRHLNLSPQKLDQQAYPIPLLPSYRQVFGEKTGFLPNLSIVDPLFNIGPVQLSVLLKNASFEIPIPEP